MELLREYSVYLCVERGLRPLSVSAYITDLEQFAEFMEKTEGTLLVAVQSDVAGFLGEQRNNQVGDRTLARKLSALKGFYRWLLKDKRKTLDPTMLIESPSRWKTLPKSIDRVEMNGMLDRLSAAAEADDAGRLQLRDHAILEVFYGAGLRASELCDLRVEDVNFEISRAHVRGKGDKERIVPLGQPACRALQEYLERGRPSLARGAKVERAMFLSIQGAPISREWIWALVKSWSADKKASPHKLRHSMATHMVENGADLRTVQTILGHADVGTTEVYTQLAVDHLKASHRRFHPRGRLKVASQQG